MSEQTPDEIEGIVYVGEDGEPLEGDPIEGTAYDGQQPEEVTPQSRDAHLEGKVVSLPPLTTARELLDGADDPLASLPVEPPDDETPPDPTPLTDKAWGPRGDARRDERDAKHRELAQKANQEIAAHPGVATATAQEAVRLAQKKAIQEAFVKAHKAKK
jgi:hypothetical protein